MEAFKQKTSLMDIRDFLSAHNYQVTPWENPKNVIERLYLALEEKKEDSIFWNELRDLAQRLEDNRFKRDAFDGSWVFQGATLEKLIDDLRISLNGSNDGSGGGRPTLKRWLSKSLSTAALFSFLLLGVSLGCEMSGDDSYEPDGLCDSAVEQGLSGEDGDVYCALVEIIQNSDIPNYDKKQLMNCLPELDAYVREELLNMFQQMSDEDLASYLEDEGICPIFGDDDDDDDDDNDDDDTWNDDDDH